MVAVGLVVPTDIVLLSCAQLLIAANVCCSQVFVFGHISVLIGLLWRFGWFTAVLA